MYDPRIDELTLLLHKVVSAEDLVRRAEQYYAEHAEDWRDSIRGYFLDILERKKDQIHYEWSRVDKLGYAIALDRQPEDLNLYKGADGLWRGPDGDVYSPI